MARQNIADVTFTQPRVFTVNGTRQVVKVLTAGTSRLAVDEELGILYVDDLRYSIHNPTIDHWRHISSAGADATKARAEKARAK